MLTVKIFRNKNEDGLGLGIDRILSALEVATNYYTVDGVFDRHYVVVTDYKGNDQSFDLLEGTRIYIENMSGKTVQVYQYSPPIQ
ncbi:hypothetical protein NVP1193O_104 [Vibrio phage 1.193.O._10N.286.52.C6]|nr:hypothetical protein NVP1193O_104 [Vibrio phage 1.193.O._10N.286.52.C6]